jgi:hypothetical protein
LSSASLIVIELKVLNILIVSTQFKFKVNYRRATVVRSVPDERNKAVFVGNNDWVRHLWFVNLGDGGYCCVFSFSTVVLGS